MISSGKRLRELSSSLDKDNNILISEAIKLLRENPPFEGAIGLLTSFYDKTDDSSIRKTIEEFMNDLKEQSATEEVITEIKKQWKAGTTSMLISSCWQSGLNYSEYSLDIAKVFLKESYVTAVECLTVIEESAPELSREKKDEIIKLIEECLPEPVNEKKALTLELLKILKR